MTRTLLAVMLLAAPAFGADDPKADLAGLIETLGSHQTETTRHAIEIEGCQMTIYFWEDWDARKLALHSVHHIDLSNYAALKDRPEKRKVPWFSLGATSQVLMIEMRPPHRLQSELAMRSNPKAPYRLSTRDDVDDFVVRDRLFHGLRFDQLAESGRMAALGEMIDTYHLAYCVTVG